MCAETETVIINPCEGGENVWPGFDIPALRKLLVAKDTYLDIHPLPGRPTFENSRINEDSEYGAALRRFFDSNTNALERPVAVRKLLKLILDGAEAIELMHGYLDDSKLPHISKHIWLDYLNDAEDLLKMVVENGVYLTPPKQST